MVRKRDKLSRRINARMTILELHPEDMARRFGVSERTWFYWLASPKDQITIGRLEVIAEILKTSPAELLRSDEA